MPQRLRFLLPIILLTLPALLTAQEDLRDLVRRVKPAVVTIAVFDSTGQPLGMGSGFFVAGDRIITSRHVVARASHAEYRISTGEVYPVEGVVAEDTDADLVKLAVRGPTGEVTTLAISSEAPEEGTGVVAIGSPRGLELTVSEGIISSVRNDPMIGSLLQITAPISSGSSGGPILNRKGEVVGVASGVIAEGQNLNFAVPAAKVLGLVDHPLLAFDVWREAGHTSFDPLAPPPLPPGLAENPEKAAFLADYAMMRGRIHYERGELELAVEMTTTAAMLKPSLFDAWLINGTAEMRMRHYDHAVLPLQQAVRLRPNNVAVRTQLGDAFYHQKMYAEAARVYGDAIRVDSTYGRAWTGLGCALYYGEGADPTRRPPAVAALRRGLTYDSTVAEAWYMLGHHYVSAGKIEEGIDAFRRSVALEPDIRNGVLGLADALVSLDRWEEGADVWRVYLQRHPEDAEGHLRIGMAMNRVERFADAIPSLRRSIELRPDHGLAHYSLSIALAATGKQEEGFGELIEAIRHDPDLAVAHHALGMAYLHYRKDKAAALEEYKILKGLDPVMAKDLFEAIYR